MEPLAGGLYPTLPATTAFGELHSRVSTWACDLGTGTCAQKGPKLGLMRYSYQLEILNNFWTRAPHVHFALGTINYIASAALFHPVRLRMKVTSLGKTSSAPLKGFHDLLPPLPIHQHSANPCYSPTGTAYPRHTPSPRHHAKSTIQEFYSKLSLG